MTTENVFPYEKIVDINKPFDESFKGERHIYFTNEKIPYRHFFI